MNIPMAIVFATADCLGLHHQKQDAHSGRVSEVRFNRLKSSRDSSRQYSSKKMHPRQLFLGRVSIATGVRDSTTNKNKRFKGFRPQLKCALLGPFDGGFSSFEGNLPRLWVLLERAFILRRGCHYGALFSSWIPRPLHPEP